MVDEMKKYLYSLLTKIDGLYSVVVSDRDGVPILKASSEKAPESALRPCFLSTFGMATDQGSKLGLGRNNAVICLYNNFQVVQINDLPLIVSFIASHSCNTGHILNHKQTLQQLLQPLKGSVVEP
ncbi:ragulator complex protein LAMTOR3-A [Homalodisca vitripennis]|uniref:Roadblock/LAMTOR2 domain-containing protein n=1 Tax=Homalodisca liturata TaxID=320908 RepID=A0A1B6J741_9HEMI|nr:ragulator complex protein LAMTOR3-A [Homalodisca vitripennis]